MPIVCGCFFITFWSHFRYLCKLSHSVDAWKLSSPIIFQTVPGPDNREYFLVSSFFFGGKLNNFICLPFGTRFVFMFNETAREHLSKKHWIYRMSVFKGNKKKCINLREWKSVSAFQFQLSFRFKLFIVKFSWLQKL